MSLSMRRPTDANENASLPPIERIRKYINQPPENTRVFEITPDVAKTLLDDYNTGNRPKKPIAITKYANHMTAGTWALTGDTIKFSDHARLRDGQNRLFACCRSGRSFKTHIVFGILDSAFDILDQGKGRTGADVLAIAGFQNTTALSGAVRWVHLIATGRAKQRDTLEPDERLRLLNKTYQGLERYIKQARAISVANSQPIGLVIAMLHLFHNANAEAAKNFATAWELSDRGGRFKPIHLMQMEIANIQSNSSGRVHDVVRAALIVLAWNLFITKKKGTSSQMKWSPQEAFPEILG